MAVASPSTNTAQTLARLAEIRELRARASYARAREALAQRQAQRARVVEGQRTAEAELVGPGRSQPAAIVQLVGDARLNAKHVVAALDGAMRREAAKMKAAKIEHTGAARRSMSARRIADYVSTAERTARRQTEQRLLEETAAVSRAVAGR